MQSEKKHYEDERPRLAKNETSLALLDKGNRCRLLRPSLPLRTIRIRNEYPQATPLIQQTTQADLRSSYWLELRSFALQSQAI